MKQLLKTIKKDVKEYLFNFRKEFNIKKIECPKNNKSKTQYLIVNLLIENEIYKFEIRISDHLKSFRTAADYELLVDKNDIIIFQQWKNSYLYVDLLDHITHSLINMSVFFILLN